MNITVDTEALRATDEGAAMLTRVRSLQNLLRDNADLARNERRVPEENIKALQQAGFFLALQPSRWGGYELDPQDFFRMQMAIAESCMSTAWALLGGILPDGTYRTFLVPHSDYRIEDTWRSMGLQGTGSNDIVVDGAFVPDYRTHKQSDGFAGTNPGVTQDSSCLYHLPWAQLCIRVVSTPAIGAARRALALYTGLVKGKSSGDVTKLAQDHGTQMRIAAVKNSIEEMTVVLLANFDAMMGTLRAGGQIALEERVLYRYQAALVIDKCIEAVDTLFSSAGGSSVFHGSPIQHCFLDIHIARAHVANNPTSFARNLGAVSLGAANSDFFV